MARNFEPVDDDAEEDETMDLSDPESRDSMESDFGNDSEDSGREFYLKYLFCCLKQPVYLPGPMYVQRMMPFGSRVTRLEL